MQGRQVAAMLTELFEFGGAFFLQVEEDDDVGGTR